MKIKSIHFLQPPLQFKYHSAGTTNDNTVVRWPGGARVPITEQLSHLMSRLSFFFFPLGKLLISAKKNTFNNIFFHTFTEMAELGISRSSEHRAKGSVKMIWEKRAFS